MTWRSVRAIRTVLFALSLTLIAQQLVAAEMAGLSKGDSAKLAYARATDASVVNISILTDIGATSQVVDAIEARGGMVRYRFDAAAFVVAALPIDRVADVRAMETVEAIAIDTQPSWRARGYRPEVQFDAVHGLEPSAHGDHRGNPQRLSQRNSWPPVPRDYPVDDPYPILRDIDGIAFLDRHPTYDGRGIVIAHLETAPDFLLPELQTAYSLEGDIVPKFVDIVRVPTPAATLEMSPDRTGRGWVRLGRQITSIGRTLHAGDNTYSLPDSGTYRLGKLALDDALVRWAGLVERDDNGNGTERAEESDEFSLSVLRSETSGVVWLDTDRDRDFADEVGVGEYRSSGQIGEIGEDDPTTERRETVAFVVQSDTEDEFVALTFGTSIHASAVAGAAASNRGDEGRIDGVAPGAQLLAIAHGGTTSSYGQGLVLSFSDPRTDIVLVEAYSPATDSYSSPHLRNGTSLLSLLTARLVALYNKPCFFTAGNGPAMSMIGDISMAEGVIAVSAYQSSGSVLVNNGLIVDRTDDMHFAGTHGPSGHGAIKPDLLAPANPLTLSAGFERSDQANAGQKLPIGYRIGGGTSIAAPVAAGAAALLASAAKQTGLPHDGRTISRALLSSARFLNDFPAYQQGHGLIRIDAAWRNLQSQAVQPEPIVVEVSAPVRTATSHMLRPPHRGVGLFEREGWSPGDKGVRTIILTRTSGPRHPMSFRARWVGNRVGTFLGAASVTLPFGEAVPVPITVAPTEAGVHSAILYLDHQSIVGPAASIGATIVAADDFDRDEDYTIVKTFKVRQPSGRVSHFFRVPSDADAFSIEFEHSAEWMAPHIISPSNRVASGSLAIDPVWGRGHAAIPQPTAGVWEVVFWNRGGNEFDWNTAGQLLEPHDVKMQIKLFGLDIRHNAIGDIAGGRISGNWTRSDLSVHNRFAPFEGAVVSSALASLRLIRKSIGAGEQHVHDVLVDVGSELLVAEIPKSDGLIVDTDLHLFDCTGDMCIPARRSASFAMAERVLVQEPAPGLWRIVVDASSASVGGSRYELRAFFTNPGMGVMSVADPSVWRATGDSWKVRARSWEGERPTDENSAAQIMYAINPRLESLHFPIRPETSFSPGLKLYRISRFDKNLVPLGLAIVGAYGSNVVLR